MVKRARPSVSDQIKRKAPSTKHTISLDDALDALRRSGYLLETRVAKVLSGFGSHTEVNVVYTDPWSKLPRELDAYCLKAELSDAVEFLEASAHLLIECINNPQPIAFFSSS